MHGLHGYRKMDTRKDLFAIEGLQGGAWVTLYQCRPLDDARNIARTLARLYRARTRVTFGDDRVCAGAEFGGEH